MVDEPAELGHDQAATVRAMVWVRAEQGSKTAIYVRVKVRNHGAIVESGNGERGVLRVAPELAAFEPIHRVLPAHSCSFLVRARDR